ncbi:MAG: gfo/Idh/MocA family oxidoreductase, partial [Planctomycetota bacterium]|nr:gfo/Idh/MocA family oxidoreductase [Planctomycetota bacterium]
MSKKATRGADGSSRRQFIVSSGKAVAAATLASAIAARSYAAEDNTIKLALIGCGGRGTGAASEALSTKGPTKLWAMADFFKGRLDGSLAGLSKKFGDKKEKVDVPPERQFVGLDGYKKAIDSLEKGDVVLLATPPGFRPIHFEYAVQKERHVFFEKSFAVDAPGV